MASQLSSPLARIRYYTHFFTVEPFSPRITGILFNYIGEYIEKVWFQERGSKPRLIPGKIYASRTVDNREFRLHMGQLKGFLDALSRHGVDESLIEFVNMERYKPRAYKFKLTPEKTLRDYQMEARDFALDSDDSSFNSSLISIPTGGGKTVVLCSIAEAVGQNVAIAVLPRYMEKWGGDLVENLCLKKKDIMMVTGSKQLKGLIHMAKCGTKPPFVSVLSLVTLQGFFDTYEKDPKLCLEEYGAIPQDIWKLLGIGLVGIDEAHEHLYSVFRLTLHLHGPKFVALSGTMLSEDVFVEKIQKTIFPHSVRYDKVKMKKYIKLIPMAYEFQDIRRSRIRTSSFGRTTYSQVEYEKSIIKNPYTLSNYLAMIKDVVDMGYIDDKKDGDKLAIYCGTIDMCTRVTNYLKSFYKDLDVRRYVEKDPYKNVIEADIRVTTIISAGTALDIPNLTRVISTNNISSHKANYQLLGRLRELKDREVKMYYLYCEQVPKHVQYHQNRMELYEDRVASIHCLKLPHKL